MKNIILIIMMVFSLVWSQDASAKASKGKKRPTVSHKKHGAKAKKKSVSAKPAKSKKKQASGKPVKAAPKVASYRSSYLRKKHGRSIASVPSTKGVKPSKSHGKAHSKKNRNH